MAVGFLRVSLALRALVLVIKAFLDQRSMNEAFSGGLGSYSIICLSRGLVLVDVSEDPERRASFSSLWDIVYTVTGLLVLDAMLVGAWRQGLIATPG